MPEYPREHAPREVWIRLTDGRMDWIWARPEPNTTHYILASTADEWKHQRDRLLETIEAIREDVISEAGRVLPSTLLAMQGAINDTRAAITDTDGERDGPAHSQELRGVTGWGSKEYPEDLLSQDEVDKVVSELRRRGIEIAVGADDMGGVPTWVRIRIDGRLVIHQIVYWPDDE